MTEPKRTRKARTVNEELTQNEDAERKAKRKQPIVNWENGKTPIKYVDLMKLSEIYSMPIQYLRVPEGD